MSQLSPVSFMGTALVPAVLVSACALLLLSFNNRIVAVLTRQRALHRELLEGARKARGASLTHAQLVHPGISSVWANELSASMNSRASSNKDLAAKEDQIMAEERFASTEWHTAIERQINELVRPAARGGGAPRRAILGVGVGPLICMHAFGRAHNTVLRL